MRFEKIYDVGYGERVLYCTDGGWYVASLICKNPLKPWQEEADLVQDIWDHSFEVLKRFKEREKLFN